MLTQIRKHAQKLRNYMVSILCILFFLCSHTHIRLDLIFFFFLNFIQIFYKSFFCWFFFAILFHMLVSTLALIEKFKSFFVCHSYLISFFAMFSTVNGVYVAETRIIIFFAFFLLHHLFSFFVFFVSFFLFLESLLQEI